MKTDSNSDTSDEVIKKTSFEASKRKKEVFWVLSLGTFLLLLTWFEFRLAGISQRLPFVHSIFFFGLVNFNIVLVLLLFFLIFRNVVKVFVERQSKILGSSLKSKLVLSFISFSSIPTALMLMIFVFYINSSLDKWFSVKSISVLKNSLEVNQEYIQSAKKKNYHFANEVSQQMQGLLKSSKRKKNLSIEMSRLRELYAVDAIEYYPSLFGKRTVVISKDEAIPEIPGVSLEFLKKAIQQHSEASTLQEFGDGNLVRVIVPLTKKGSGAIVVSSYIPFSLISKIDGISAAYEELKNLDPLQYPLRSIYLIVLVLMTLVIVLCATWFGFYLARQLSIPLESLGLATQRVAQGDYQPVEISTGSAEMNQLIGNFNQMMQYLDRSKSEVLQANRHLTETLERLDEHSRYIQVVLSNVTTGVISIDQNGMITTVNHHASQLLGIETDQFVGRHIKAVLPLEYYNLFKELLTSMKSHQATSLQKELRLDLGGRSIPFQLTISLLQDEKGHDLGKVVVFDDLTPVINAQRAAAWTEVARRIAHEIKNPLTPIKLSAQRLEKKFGSQIQDPAFANSIKMIIQQTDELKTLVNEFHHFARLPQLKAQLGSLNQCVDDALVLFRTAHKDVEIQFKPDASLPHFLFDPDQMKRVMLNLVDNAVAAVENQHQAKIEVITNYNEELKLAKVSVIDNGMGISEENRQRIFEPYFSTKESGTGLGLAIVKRIIEDHSGFIRALAHKPRGTKFVIELPIQETQFHKKVDSELDFQEQSNSKGVI